MATPINNSNLPSVQSFKFEDYPGAEQWFSQFLNSLNLFVQPVYQLLDAGVGYQNLLIPRNYTKTITAPAAGSVTFNFSNPLKIAPTSVLLGNVYVIGNPTTHPTSPAVVYWHFSQGNIYVDNITNLTASTTYSVTLTVF